MSIVVVSVNPFVQSSVRARVGLMCSEIVRKVRHRSLSGALLHLEQHCMADMQAPSNASRGNDVFTVYNGWTTM
jgi:hypothetical protein